MAEVERRVVVPATYSYVLMLSEHEAQTLKMLLYTRNGLRELNDLNEKLRAMLNREPRLR